jgi:hypothetical protein
MLSRRDALTAMATVPVAATPAAAALKFEPRTLSPAVADDGDASADVILWSDILARLEVTVRTLRDRFVKDGFELDEAAAEAALAYIRSRAAGEPIDDEADRQFVAFLVDHGQPLDYVIVGDIGSLMCLCAEYDYGRDLPAFTKKLANGGLSNT